MIHQARKEAIKSKCRCKHGAVITRGGSTLSKGYNSYKPHPTFGGGPLLTLHAEAAAIRFAVNKGINLKGATIYVVRHGGLSDMSKPCLNCEELIRAHGIRKVVYTNKLGNIITERYG